MGATPDSEEPKVSIQIPKRSHAMPRKKQIDNPSLIQMVKDGAVQNKIMATFGFKTSTQLKVAYGNALIETGRVPALKAGRSGKTKAIDPTVTVNKRGSLTIPKHLVQLFGLLVGDAFEVRKSPAGLSLQLKEVPLSFPKS
jgi:hypothetical protein